MQDLMITNISPETFAALTALAAKNGLSIEEQARRILYEYFDIAPPSARPEVSAEFLRMNPDEVLAAAERSPIFVRDHLGREFVIISADEFERLSRPE